jgi:hypothetical protein
LAQSATSGRIADHLANVRDAGGTITANNLKWNQGKDWTPPPRDKIELEINA